MVVSEGQLGLPTWSGCHSSTGRALLEAAPEGTERGAGNERVRQWMHCFRGMCACGAACALQLGMPAVGAPGGSSSRAAGAVGHVDWGCGSTECRVHSAHHPSATGHTPTAHKFAATSGPRSLKLLPTLGLAPAGKLTATRSTWGSIKAHCQSNQAWYGQDARKACQITENGRTSRAPVCRQVHVGPAEAHRPSVPSNLCIYRETEVVGGFAVARTTGDHPREPSTPNRPRGSRPPPVTRSPWRWRKLETFAIGTKAEDCWYGHNTRSGCPCAAVARNCGHAEFPGAAQLRSHRPYSQR